MDATAEAVSEDLYFDVTRRGDVFLDENTAVAERRGGFTPRRMQRLGKILRTVHSAHALAAAAGDRLDEHRIANFGGGAGQKVRVLLVAVITWDDRHTGALHERFRLVLEPHGPDRRGRRTNKYNACRGASLGE